MKEKDLQLAEDRIRKTKLELMLDNKTVFFCALLANLRLIITTDEKTAATDGIHLWMNPVFAAKQTGPQLLGLMLHEVMHVALQHMRRQVMLTLNGKVWNIACDHYINLYLTHLGYQLPLGGHMDFKFSGWSPMEIYEELMKDPPDPPDYNMDLVMAGADKDLTDAEIDELEEQAITNVTRAVIEADMAGKPGSVPAEIRTILEEKLNPQLPWEVIFQNHMNQYAKDDYSWSRPNKRYLPDVYLPHMKSEKLDKMYFARDTSGSMTIPWLEAITCEMQYVWDVLQPVELRVVDFDTEVHRDVTHAVGDEFDALELFGGGGTDPTPIIEMIRQESPTVAVIFSDGEFDMPDLSNLYTDLIWVIVDDPSFTAPYGTVIHFDSSKQEQS